ncbi:hypothetical protein D9611_013517 [Ephemerocybe angulata]|uniref:Uncharacterized protein n=1 Tax=Ephemerocybe angulata TaxID=980116 RepID=A0A8H5BSU5_9AGAR|nr:hypothetical protein D9611_013517 [Tulosesus angulatus]
MSSTPIEGIEGAKDTQAPNNASRDHQKRESGFLVGQKVEPPVDSRTYMAFGDPFKSAPTSPDMKTMVSASSPEPPSPSSLAVVLPKARELEG